MAGINKKRCRVRARAILPSEFCSRKRCTCSYLSFDPFSIEKFLFSVKIALSHRTTNVFNKRSRRIFEKNDRLFMEGNNLEERELDEWSAVSSSMTY